MKNILYYWSKLIKKIPGTTIDNSTFESPSKAEARSTIINSSMGMYSYCGYGCKIINTEIGRFCSISDNVSIGLTDHPISWVSTSPAFYKGRDSIPKNLASLDYPVVSPRTIIGNDVWIGEGVKIKAGIRIGNGSVVAMGSVVTNNVPPYVIVGGTPARQIRKRFSDDIIKKIEDTEWWKMEPSDLKKISHTFSDVESFINAMGNRGE